MIEKMKRLSVVTLSSRKEALLEALFALGILHIAEKKDADPVLAERMASLSGLQYALRDYRDKNADPPPLDGDTFEALVKEAQDTLAKKDALLSERAALSADAATLAPWGNFDPAEVRALRETGVDLHFYRIDKKGVKRLAKEEIRYFRLCPVEKTEAVAVLGKLDGSYGATEFSLPERSLTQTEAAIARCDGQLAECEAILKRAANALGVFSAQRLQAQNDAEYSAVSRTAEDEDGLVWLSGYIPAAEEARFIAAAEENGWAWMMEDAAEDDPDVPTKIRYNKLTALVKPVFDILGTVPGYGEYDISFWFLAFFTLFFAMIIGDAGYGALFLLVTVILHIRTKKVSNAVLLLYVLSGATVIWGALTGTWFGLEGAMDIPFFRAFVLPGFANYPEKFGMTAEAGQNNMMRFCFSIGAIQLSLACIMNIRRKLARKDLSWLADLGWFGAICSLYFVILYLVIGQSINVALTAAIVAVGFLLVLLFGGMAPGKRFSDGLKAGLSGAFTTFLNTISAFGNVMSYIRLFAVGMASLAIAQSFNGMAEGFDGVLVIVGAVVMIFGHLLNIVMGFLSVAVHGVRLNLMEFSGQLGMEWSGTAYAPFGKQTKLKK